MRSSPEVSSVIIFAVIRSICSDQSFILQPEEREPNTTQVKLTDVVQFSVGNIIKGHQIKNAAVYVSIHLSPEQFVQNKSCHMHKGNVDIATRIQFNEFGNLTSVTIWTPLNDNFLESGNGMCYLDNVFIDLSVVVQHMAISSSKDWFVESKLYDNSSIDIFNVSVFAEARIITTGLHLKISGKESLLFMYIKDVFFVKCFLLFPKEKERIWQRPMTKASIPSDKKSRDNTKTAPKPSIIFTYGFVITIQLIIQNAYTARFLCALCFQKYGRFVICKGLDNSFPL